jgi:hypothetical protein
VVLVEGVAVLHQALLDLADLLPLLVGGLDLVELLVDREVNEPVHHRAVAMAVRAAAEAGVGGGGPHAPEAQRPRAGHGEGHHRHPRVEHLLLLVRQPVRTTTRWGARFAGGCRTCEEL